MKKTLRIKMPQVIYEGKTLDEGYMRLVKAFHNNTLIYLRDVNEKVALFADTSCNGLWFLYFEDTEKNKLIKLKLC